MFPTDPVPVVVEIAPGADPAASDGTWSWVDITDRVRLADRVRIVTGRQNEASQVDPSRCTMTLNNSTGDFTPRNPYGQWYGQIGRNTPLRVRIRRGEDGFDRTTSNGWGTADSGQEWTASGSAAADYSVSGGAARISHGTANVLRRVTLDVALADPEQMVDVSTPVLLTGGALVTGVLARYQDASNYYWLRVELDKDSTDVIVKISKTVGGAETELGVLDPVPGLAYAAGVPLRMRARVLGNRLSIKAWTASDAEPSGWHLEVTDDALTAAGATGVQSWVVAGNTNTLPLVVSFSGYAAHVDRFCGFVSSWPPRWDATGSDSTVPIQADGVLRRLSQGSPPARSALRRTIPASGALAYWPMEDGDDASQAASAFVGHPPLAASGTVAFAPIESWTSSKGYAVTYGTQALADLSKGASFAAPVPPDVTAATANAWTVAIAADIDSGVPSLSGDLVLLEMETAGGTFVRWRLVIEAATSHTKLLADDATGTPTTVFDDPGVNSGMILHNIAVWQNGSNISAGYIRWSNGTGYFVTGSTAGTLGGVTAVLVNPTQTTATIPLPAGHLAVWAGRDLDAVDLDDGAVNLALYSYGWTGLGGAAQPTGEAATVRLTRLCAEDGIALDVPAVDLADEVMMGVQKPGGPLDLYRECETADLGVLHELGFGLGYVPRDARYNRPHTLRLDYTAGQVAPPLEPVDDDHLLRNRVTVRRVDGSSATAEDSVSIASAGPYESSVDVSMADDMVLLDHASWRTHVGSTPVMRWPQISVNLARSPELVDDALSTRVQSRIGVVNPPAQVVGDDIDVIAEGYSETIGHKDWQVSFNTSPARPWDVPTIEGDYRVAAAGSALAADLTASGTSLLLASTAENGPWTEDAGDMPLDLRVGGERVTATAIGRPFVDTFSRTVAAGGWGGSWTISSGTASNFSVNGSQGVVSLSTLNAEQHATFDVGSAAAQDVRLWCTLPVTPSGAPINWGILLRFTDANNYYWADAQVPVGGGNITVRLIKRVAGVATQIATATTAVAHSTSVPLALRAVTSGSTFRVRLWSSDATEPTTWDLSTTDTDLTSGTRAGVVCRLMTGNTNTPVSFQFDNVVQHMPQTVTLSARAVNGVSRAWPAGTEVDVWFPAIAAL